MRKKIWSILYFGISVLSLLVLASLSTDKVLVVSPTFFVFLIGVSSGLIGMALGNIAFLYYPDFDSYYNFFSNFFAMAVILAIVVAVILL